MLRSYLLIAAFQVGLLIGGLACLFIFVWINERSGGCILSFSLYGTCVIDSVLLTAFGSAGLTAAGAVLYSFKYYLD